MKSKGSSVLPDDSGQNSPILKPKILKFETQRSMFEVQGSSVMVGCKRENEVKSFNINH